jgi:hypothetical protein
VPDVKTAVPAVKLSTTTHMKGSKRRGDQINRRAVVITNELVCLGGPPTRVKAGHVRKIRPSLPGEIQPELCKCNSLID